MAKQNIPNSFKCSRNLKYVPIWLKIQVASLAYIIETHEIAFYI